MLLPLLFLYILSWKLWNLPHFHTNAEHLLLAANIIAPPVIGTLLYQLKLYATNDAGLVGFSFLLSIPLVLFAEYVAKEKRHVFLLPLYSTITFICFYLQFELSTLSGSLLILLLGSIFLLLGNRNQPGILTFEQKFQTLLGLVASGIGLICMPFTVYEFNATLPGFSLIQIAFFALSSLLFFLLAMYSADLWKRHSDIDFIQARSIFEISSPILLIIPVASSALNSDNFIYTALLILFSVLTLTASYYVAVKAFRLLGWGGLIVGLLPLFGTLFRSLEVFWPIALVLGGVALIGASIALTSFEVKNVLNWFTKEPETPLFGLGEQHIKEFSQSEAKPSTGTGCFTIFAILVIFLIILALIN